VVRIVGVLVFSTQPDLHSELLSLCGMIVAYDHRSMSIKIVFTYFFLFL
jgi:hypothetical protein